MDESLVDFVLWCKTKTGSGRNGCETAVHFAVKRKMLENGGETQENSDREKKPRETESAIQMNVIRCTLLL